MKFRVLAALAVLLLSAPSALGVQRALAPTRGDVAGWLAAAGIELAYLSLAFVTFADQRRQRLAARVARAAVLTAITLNVIADYAARVPAGLSGAAQFLATFDWLLLALSLLESAPLAALAYTLATLLHSSAADAGKHTVEHQQHTADAAEHMLQHQQHTAEQQRQQRQHQQQRQQHSADAAEHMLQHTADAGQHTADAGQHMLQHTAERQHQHQQHQHQQHQHQQHTADAGQHTTDAGQYTAGAAEHMLQHQQHTAEQQRQQQRAALSYRCPRCGAALTQQQYGAAKRYGYCGKCKGK